MCCNAELASALRKKSHFNQASRCKSENAPAKKIQQSFEEFSHVEPGAAGIFIEGDEKAEIEAAAAAAAAAEGLLFRSGF
jgi:hypothetical protein